MLDEQIEKNTKLRTESEGLKEKLMRMEHDLRIETENSSEKEKLMKEKLDRILEDIDRLNKEKMQLKDELNDLTLKYKESSYLQKNCENDKTKLEAQIENLISSKQLLQKTMTGQLMSIKSQLDDANEEKQKLSDELRRINDSKNDIEEKYRTEQLKTKTLMEEIRRSKYKK